MKHSDYKVLLTTSGIGSRLGDLTKNTNKALVKLNNKATISYIFDLYPREVTFVVTLGYLADQVREFITANHADRKIEFVIVDKYQGPKTSLGYSMLRAKDNLQCPFIFHACDTIVTEDIPKPDHNWVGGLVVNEQNSDLPLAQYRTQVVKDGFVAEFKEKGVSGFESIHIGFTGIFDYRAFWEALTELYSENPDYGGLCDVHVDIRMMKRGFKFSWVPYKIWLDTGNINAFKKTEKYFKNS